MSVRLTGISTPIGGLSWEYTGSEENADSLQFFFLKKYINKT